MGTGPHMGMNPAQPCPQAHTQRMSPPKMQLSVDQLRQRREQGDSRLSVDERSLSPEMNLNLGLCYLLALCWSPDLHSRAIANMNIVHIVKD